MCANVSLPLTWGGALLLLSERFLRAEQVSGSDAPLPSRFPLRQDRPYIIRLPGSRITKTLRCFDDYDGSSGPGC